MMRIAVAIQPEHDTLFSWRLGVGRSAFALRLRGGATADRRGLGVFFFPECVPAVDLGEHGFHLRIAQVIFGVPPIQRAQWLVERIV